jgi:NAD(P)-dependent dehydrogenase (short-subunit alcohol dehydrogenase family)
VTVTRNSLDGKTAIVTGGGRGIGRGIALALASCGASVAVCGRSQSPLQETAREIAARGGRASAIPCDVTDLSQLEALVHQVVAEYGGVNILVNNAMQIPRGTVLDMSEETIDAAWLSSPMASLRLMRLCYPYLKGGGSIINVSSATALKPETPLRGIYAGIKAALNCISVAAAVEWGPDGIRVNVVAPMGMTDAFAHVMEHEPDLAAKAIQSNPVGRIGDPEVDIGRVVAFLCGPDAGYVNAAIIPVDGGGSRGRG